MRECVRCGKEYDERAFLVKLKSTGRTYQSMLCKDCAIADGHVEIVEIEKQEKNMRGTGE